MDDIHIAFQMLQTVKSHVQAAVAAQDRSMKVMYEQSGEDESVEYTHARVHMLYLEASFHAVENALVAVSEACGDETYVKTSTSDACRDVRGI